MLLWTIRMWTLTLISLLFVSVLSASVENCSEMKAIRRTPSSASGRWYLVATKKQDVRGKAQRKSMTPECGDSELSCSCIGFDIDSTMMEPFVPEYNMTSFVYDMSSGKYTVQRYKMQLTNEETEMEIYSIKQTDEGETLVLRTLATDDYQSFMLLHVCNDYNQGLDIWFLSKTKMASEESINGVNKALMVNNLNMSQLAKVDQENCKYPTISISNANPANKLRFS